MSPILDALTFRRSRTQGDDRVLSNQDIAELLESTRNELQHIGSDSPTAAGVVRVLSGLIAMLREQSAEDDEDTFSAGQSTSEARSARVSEIEASMEHESEQPAAQVPGYLAHLRATRRSRPVRESSRANQAEKPANPLSNPHY